MTDFSENKNLLKGQGAVKNENNRFEKVTWEPDHEESHQSTTSFTDVFPKTIVNKIKSPDLAIEYSMNPYQGCEHGCSYCFARPSDECLGIMKSVSDAGALSAGHVLIRLNATVEPVFVHWLNAHFPDRSQKVLNLIRSMRNGNLSDSRFFERYKGDGQIAELIHNTFKIGLKKFFSDKHMPRLSTEHFAGTKEQQPKLF